MQNKKFFVERFSEMLFFNDFVYAKCFLVHVKHPMPTPPEIFRSFLEFFKSKKFLESPLNPPPLKFQSKFRTETFIDYFEVDSTWMPIRKARKIDQLLVDLTKMGFNIEGMLEKSYKATAFSLLYETFHPSFHR